MLRLPRSTRRSPRRVGRGDRGAAVGVCTLPDPSYDYAALEPHINGQILELDHDERHAAYMKGPTTRWSALLRPGPCRGGGEGFL
jgi:Iron/manganese superoxide dismutases, alpha-hairpin domain